MAPNKFTIIIIMKIIIIIIIIIVNVMDCKYKNVLGLY